MISGAFGRFWFGETLSLFGTQVTTLALPLTAIIVLGASPVQLGLLGAAQFLPYLLFTLVVGAWLDRRRRRPALIAAHLVRAALIGSVPIAALLGVLSFEWLVGVVFLVGSLTVVYEVGWLAYLPSIVDRPSLVRANSRLVASSSAAQVGGPGIAGMLIAAVSAPFALAIDAASYVVAAGSLVAIGRAEVGPPADRRRRDLLREAADGFRTTFGDPVLRAFALEAGTYNVFSTAVGTVLILFALRDVGLDAPTIGVVLSIGALGALAGSFLAAPLARRFGLGRTLVTWMVIACAAPLALPLAGGSPVLGAAILATSFLIEGVGVAISVVHVVSLRQAVTPDGELARMNGAYRTLTYGAIPLGALLGGVLAEIVGLRATIALMALAIAVAPIWVIRSPIPAFRTLEDAIAASRRGRDLRARGVRRKPRAVPAGGVARAA